MLHFHTPLVLSFRAVSMLCMEKSVSHNLIAKFCQLLEKKKSHESVDYTIPLCKGVLDKSGSFHCPFLCLRFSLLWRTNLFSCPHSHLGDSVPLCQMTEWCMHSDDNTVLFWKPLYCGLFAAQKPMEEKGCMHPQNYWGSWWEKKKKIMNWGVLVKPWKS